MGKFDGVLFFADYDDTLYNSSHTVSPENRTAIRYFMERGGRFSVATGRAHRTFTPQIEKEDIPLNAPVVLSNGAAIYDYAEDRYLRTPAWMGTPRPGWPSCAGSSPTWALRRTTARISTSTIPTP